MSVVVIGVNHRTAPLELLEKTAIVDARLDKAIDAVSKCSNVSETVVLSTCNRTEIYVLADRFHGAFQDVRDTICDLASVSPETLGDHLYFHYDEEAVRHLFSVASGLDSAVLGEHEIQGQVKKAWERAHAEGVTGTALNGVFQHALEVGKRARTETAIARNVTSVSQAAVLMAEERIGNLADKRILVLGSGDMGKRMMGRLLDADVSDLVVANRTWENAVLIADELGGRAARLADLPAELEAADIVFTSTGATDMLVEHAALAPIMKARPDRPMLIVDIAVPRDIDPSAGTIAGVTLLDMEDLREFAQAGIAERSKEVADVNHIIDQEVTQYSVRSTAREVAPLVAEFREQAVAVKDEELDKAASHLDEMSETDRELVEKITNRIVSKLLHSPTTRLKAAAGTARGERLAEALRDLYELDE